MDEDPWILEVIFLFQLCWGWVPQAPELFKGQLYMAVLTILWTYFPKFFMNTMASLCLVIPYFIQPRGSQIQISHTEDLNPEGWMYWGWTQESSFLTNSQVSRMQPNQPKFLSWDTGCFWIREYKYHCIENRSEKSRHTVNFLKDKFLEVRLLRVRLSQV